MPVDLKQVAKLFNDTLAEVWDNTPDVETVEPQAIEWLKAARHKLMCELERHYYSLDGSRHTPLSQPLWVQKPDVYSLTQGTNSLPAIRFRPGLAAAAVPPHTPRTLYVEDEFSRHAPDGGGRIRIGAGPFAASNFGRLLIDAQGESAGGSGERDSGRNNKRRRTSRPVKEEGSDNPIVKEESNEEEHGRRLRSLTRASSAATLRSAAGVHTHSLVAVTGASSIVATLCKPEVLASLATQYTKEQLLVLKDPLPPRPLFEAASSSNGYYFHVAIYRQP
ncbi:hypothetical protein B0H13DRAFT_1895160 [Mycena leptocephala]|nr:hypothetical protein B0H13DRAFT_1895160 [Mycena leptocephala]